jgi:hypothetical protein
MGKRSNGWTDYYKYIYINSVLVKKTRSVAIEWIERFVKAETESEITAAKVQASQTKHYAIPVITADNKYTANADYGNSMARQQTTLYQYAQYWQKNDT